MSTEHNNDTTRRNDDEQTRAATLAATNPPSGLPSDAEETSECPACDEEVRDGDLLDGECPNCETATDDLFLVAAGIRSAEEVRA